MAKRKRPTILRVEWIDSAHPLKPGWSPRKQTVRAVRVTSVGYIHQRTATAIVLAQSYTAGQVSGLIAIPKGCIVKTRRLK